MNEKNKNFEDWYEDIDDISDKGILLVKNGLEYEVALTQTKKPKFESQKSKMFPKTKRKKYEILGVNLLGIKKANETEINGIIGADPTQDLKYLQVYEMQLDITYTLKLTEQQHKAMLRFMKNQKIKINDPFYFRRYGKSLSTHFRFFKDSQVKKEIVQAKLKK